MWWGLGINFLSQVWKGCCVWCCLNIAFTVKLLFGGRGRPWFGGGVGRLPFCGRCRLLFSQYFALWWTCMHIRMHQCKSWQGGGLKYYFRITYPSTMNISQRCLISSESMCMAACAQIASSRCPNMAFQWRKRCRYCSCNNKMATVKSWNGMGYGVSCF